MPSTSLSAESHRDQERQDHKTELKEAIELEVKFKIHFQGPGYTTEI